jgi:hypothetical protein
MIQALNIVMARHANASRDVAPVAGSKFFPSLSSGVQTSMT